VYIIYYIIYIEYTHMYKLVLLFLDCTACLTMMTSCYDTPSLVVWQDVFTLMDLNPKALQRDCSPGGASVLPLPLSRAALTPVSTSLFALMFVQRSLIYRTSQCHRVQTPAFILWCKTTCLEGSGRQAKTMSRAGDYVTCRRLRHMQN